MNLDDVNRWSQCTDYQYIDLWEVTSDALKGKVVKGYWCDADEAHIVFEDKTFTTIYHVNVSYGVNDVDYVMSYEGVDDLFYKLACYDSGGGKSEITPLGKLLEVDLNKWEELCKSDIAKIKERIRKAEYEEYLRLKKKYEDE